MVKRGDPVRPFEDPPSRKRRVYCPLDGSEMEAVAIFSREPSVPEQERLEVPFYEMRCPTCAFRYNYARKVTA